MERELRESVFRTDWDGLGGFRLGDVPVLNGVFETSVNRGVGRPKVKIKPEWVRQLRGKGMSWRKIARTLKIGTATAMRLSRSICGPRIESDMSPQGPEPIDL